MAYNAERDSSLIKKKKIEVESKEVKVSATKQYIDKIEKESSNQKPKRIGFFLTEELHGKMKDYFNETGILMQHVVKNSLSNWFNSDDKNLNIDNAIHANHNKLQKFSCDVPPWMHDEMKVQAAIHKLKMGVAAEGAIRKYFDELDK